MDIELYGTELLSQSFSDSLRDETAECLSNILEVGLDSILQDGIVKDIPFISTAISIYRIGNSIRDRHNLKKLAIFLDKINKNLQEETTRRKYIEKFQEDYNFRNQELEFVLVLIDRYIGYDKPALLAKLYLSYLCNDIVWDEFLTYAEIIDRFLPKDVEFLCIAPSVTNGHWRGEEDHCARLVAAGLMEVVWVEMLGEDLHLLDDDRKYRVTKFGRKLADILRET